MNIPISLSRSVTLLGLLLTLRSSGLAAETDILSCSSQPGERQHCSADTSAGVALQSSTGSAPCLLGKTWGYDDAGVWVSDGCSGEFVVGQATPPSAEPSEPSKKAPAYVPNAGFLLVEGDKGEMYVRLFSYVRYLNQKGIDASYTDFFGDTHLVPQREDVQLNKFFLPFSGWFLTPKFRYYLYVWSANTSQGDPAQVVGAGNLSYTFNRFVTVGGGITSLPSVRSTEGQFPYWLGIDDRLTADEFFRGSYTTGFWLKGELSTELKYMAMVANNLSTLGVSAAQLDNELNTSSFMLQWLPTTGEFGLYGTFGDFDHHETVATRLAAHYTHSREDKQSQPGTDSIENSQIRLTDGSVIFTPNLFGPGIVVDKVDYDMVSLDAGVKYRGLSLEAEYYWRWLGDFEGPNTSGIADIDDHGFQVQSSGMLLPKTLQAYFSGSAIRGRYGNASEVRAGANWYFVKERGLRLNAEWIHLNNCPVGYTAVPYPVGGNGSVFHTNLEMNF
ncbi:MAG TPA: DUF3011 domain-containing protein [Vicinamibacteria bacterium]|nr:DUF3011 domain-containing protein [Vicinamibacteria bacterium]